VKYGINGIADHVAYALVKQESGHSKGSPGIRNPVAQDWVHAWAIVIQGVREAI
jgi:hypothetical protein